MSDRLKDLTVFSEEYEKLSDTRRNEFARLVDKLLRDTYIVRKKGEDAGDYFAVVSNRPLFETYLSVVYIANRAGRNRVRLSKFETCFLLVLRKMFIKKAREASSSDKILVPLSDAIKEMKAICPIPGSQRISYYREALRKLKRHKIVDCPSEISEESTVEIYPSIALLVPEEEFDEIDQRIALLAKSSAGEKEDDDEEAD